MVAQHFNEQYCRLAFVDHRGRFVHGDRDLAKSVFDGQPFEDEPIVRRDSILVLKLPTEGFADSATRAPDMTGISHAVACFDQAVLRRRLDQIGTAYGMSGRQVELLEALVDTGALRAASLSLGLDYVTSRNLLAELKAKLGLDTVPMIVGLMFELLGDEERAAGTPLRHDLFGLTERQFAIASAIGIYKTRAEIAGQLRISAAVIDAELKNIFLILAVNSAGEVTRALAEVRIGLGRVPRRALPHMQQHGLPALSIVRAGRSIGFSDFGPAGAKPVLILHSTITSRAPPTRLVEALQRNGFRPLAVDRPGYGDTDPAPRNEEHHACAAADLAAVCAALGLAEIDVVARGAGQASVLLGHQLPQLIRRVILVNPMPAKPFTTIDRGPLGAVKRRFARSPRAIEAMIRMLAAYATPHRMRDGMIRSFRGSPPDEALIHDDPRFMADYLRATRRFADGVVQGYVAEQAAWAQGLDVPRLPDKTGWRIVQARHFVLHDPAQAMGYWQDRLPDTPVTWVEEAGQMLAYSHPEAVVEALLTV